MANSTVALRESPEGAEHRVWHHDEQRHHPRGGNDAISVRSSLPCTRLERVADGTVSLYGNGHKAEGGDADRDACRKETESKHVEAEIGSWWSR